MALRPWLEHTFQEELLLGNSWLHDKNDRKETGVKSEFDKAWARLYHDNGSCLDITNDRHPDQNSTLRVIQTHPLTLSDGQYHIIAHLTSNCTRDLAERFPGRSLAQLRTVIAVRKYAIRYTSYGPPRDKLRFLLDTVDWLGVEAEGTLATPVVSLQPLHWNERVGAILEQLHITRAKADRRRLRQASEQEPRDTEMAHTVDQEASSPQTQRPSTQLPFGTQLAHPIQPRSRPNNDEPVFLGIHRMEPVSVGNVRQSEIRPKTTTSDYDKQMQLLSLLEGQQPSRPKPSYDNLRRPALNNQHHVTQPPSPANRAGEASLRSQSKRTLVEPEPVANRGRRERDLSLSPAVEPEDVISTLDDSIDQPEPDDLRVLASDCSWMAGFAFDRDTFQLSEEQKNVLTRDQSWYKPEVGVLPFPDGNMPIKLFTELRELAEEEIAAESDQDSDEDEDDDMDLDSSPDSVSEEPMLDITQEDEPSTSPVSWTATPTPEPPERPVRPRQGLPPDSSFEAAALAAKSTVAQEVAPVLDQRSESHAAIESSNDKDLNAPPSSPPLPVQSADEDEDVEMETSVPQALGEDVVPNARPQDTGTVLHQSSSPKRASFVQVKETPYTARKQNQIDPREPSPPRQIQDSSGNSKSIISTSIVYGTYKEQPSSGSPKNSNQLGQDLNTIAQVSDNHTLSTMQQTKQKLQDRFKEGPTQMAHEMVHTATPVARSGSKSAMDLISPKIQLSPAEESSREQLKPAAGLTKRKIADSPTKLGKRHSKRREIKIVGFGSESQARVDFGATLRQEREESLRRFREERKSSKSFEDQKSLAEEPSKQEDDAPMEIDSPTMETGTRLPRSMSPRHRSLYEDSGEASATKIGKQMQPSGPLDPSQSVPVFEAFRAAYPEYTGGAKHFGALCKQMYELELEDKMVPKWQWDDFIVRNRTDYKDYAVDCADQGENPEPYYRFYKDTIRDTLFRENVVGSKAVLLKALEELGIKPSVPKVQSQKSPRKNKSSRTSLPGAFNQHKAIWKDTTSGAQHDPTRRSLPSSSHNQVQPKNGTSSGQKTRAPAQPASNRQAPIARPTAKPNLLERLSSEQFTSARSTPEPTGDPFRDFVFGFQRTTSFTGSSKVDPRKPWPQNLAVRPSIADAPKNKNKKVDVLKWSDTL